MTVPSYRPTWIEIQRENLRHNLRQLRSMQVEGSFFCPIVKADAYGHGATPLAKLLVGEGCVHLGVGLVEEGLKLREEGVDSANILVFGVIEPEAMEIVIRQRLTPVLNSWRELRALYACLQEGQHFPLHIKLNTGMNKAGFPVQELESVLAFLQQQTRLKMIGICTHMASGEKSALPNSQTQRQLDYFYQTLQKQGLRLADYEVHTLNSPAFIALWSHDYFSGHKEPWWSGWRPGLAIYGIKPQIECVNEQALERWQRLDLRPLLSWKSKVALCHKLAQGETVSYGGRWQASRPSLIASIPVGYGDGLPRHLSQKGYMLFRGCRVPIVGTVCMDYTMVDLTDVLEDVNQQVCGEEVVLIGQQHNEAITASDMAGWASTIDYEILTRLGSRVPRVYV